MNVQIRKANSKDISALATVGKKAFYASHKEAIPNDIMQSYLDNNFNEQRLLEEISNPLFQYHVIYCDEKLAGYSKIILNTKNNEVNEKPITKMERLYLSEEFHGLGLGRKLFDFNINLMKKNNQKGTWLYVWIKNDKALQFYKKTGFTKVADYDFPVSDTETRPNYVMFLKF